MTVFLPKRPWMADRATTAVMSALAKAGGEGSARFVGGCVRDTLLGRDAEYPDVDIATRLTPDQVMTGLVAEGLKVEPTGLAHGTVTAIAYGRPFEITTLREDVETDGRRAVVAFTQDWAKDAARRDFTMNALYADAEGRVLDPTGRGLDDARAGRVIFVGDPDTRIREDYLRILRFFRFQAHYAKGSPDAVALSACVRLADQLAKLSAERIAKEVLKLLSAPDPGPTVERMERTGVMSRISPDLDDLSRLLGLITIETQLGRRPDPELRLAALGPKDQSRIRALAKRLKVSNALRNRFLLACPGAVKLTAATSAYELRQAIWRLGPSPCHDQLLLAWAADLTLKNSPLWENHFALVETWRPPAFPISGDDILSAGIEEGPRVGRVRQALEDWWLEMDFPQDRRAALDQLTELSKRIH